MRASVDQWPALLRRGLKVASLVAGDEPLLVMEAVDALRAAARSGGIDERVPFDVTTGFDWPAWRMETRSLGLFATRRLIELRLPNGKLSAEGASCVQEFLGDPGEDHLLIQMPEWNKTVEAQAWVSAVDRVGVILPIKALRSNELPAWLRRRAQALELDLGADAIAELVARTEGNLLAAQQELAKLALLAPDQHIDALLLTDLVAESARYTVFGLFDAVLAGEASRVRRILHALRAEGEFPAAVLPYPLSQIMILAHAQTHRDSGRPLSGFWQQWRVYSNRQAQFERALDRDWGQVLREAMVVEHACKGYGAGEPWLELERWLLRASLSPVRARRFAA